MDRKTILKHGVGTVFASKVQYSGWHNPVRLLDTRIWRHTYDARHNNTHYYHYTARTNTSGDTGYLVLRLIHPGNMSDEHRAILTERLAVTNLTAADLINDDGTINDAAVPPEMYVTTATARELTCTWADYQAEQDAERAEYQARVEADRARYAAEDAARKERADRLEAVRAAARTQATDMSAMMARMGIASGGMYPKVNHLNDTVRVEINMGALAELVTRAAWATEHAEYIPDPGCTLRRNTTQEES